jgi:hypothetical protein
LGVLVGELRRPNSPPFQGANEWALEEPLNVALSPSEGRAVLCSTEAMAKRSEGWGASLVSSAHITCTIGQKYV